MADGYGNIVAGSWRCHVAAWIVSSTDKTDTVRVQARFQAVNGWNFAINGISGSVSCNGASGSGTGNANIGTNGESTIYSKDFTVSRGESAKNITCKATVSQYYFNGGSSTASVTVTIPRVPVLKPNPPKNATFSRVSDTQMKGAWQGNWDNDAGKPWKQVIVDRRRSQNATEWGPWQNARVLDWSATNVTLTDAQPNGRYQIAIYARNAAGDSTHVDSQILYTTPAAPKSVTAVKNSETSITIKIDATNTYAKGSDIDVTSDGGQTWTSVKAGLQGTSTTWTDTNPPKGTVQYRVRLYDQTGALHSPYKLTETLSTITTPLAPTITSPTASAFKTGSTVPVKWTINHPDGTGQTAAQVEVTTPSAGVQTKQINDSATDYALAVTDPGTYKIRVRTKGLAADYGAWSQYVTVNVGKLPDITITSPIDSITGVPFTISWSVATSSGVAAQTIVLHGDDLGDLTITAPSSQRSVVVPAKNWTPPNGSTFSITITVRDGIGLTSSETQMVTVTYTPPAEPDVELVQLPDYSVAVTPTFRLFGEPVQQEYWTTGLDDGTSVLADFYTFGLSDGTSMLATLDEGLPLAETVSVSVERVYEGETISVAEALSDGQMAIDSLPPLNNEFTYRITAHAASGAVASIEQKFTVESNVNVLNFGVDASECLPLGLGQSSAWEAEHDSESFDFADGSPYPVSYQTGARTVALTENDVKAFDQEEWQRMQRLAESYAFGWYRDASGSRDYVSVRLKLAYDVTETPRTMSTEVSMVKQAWQEPRTI